MHTENPWYTQSLYPQRLNGGNVIAANHDLHHPPTLKQASWVDVIVEAPHLCRATDDPARIYVVGRNHMVGTREWGQGFYDLTWQEATDILRKRHGWLAVFNDPTV
jgi:hypothetical protein